MNKGIKSIILIILFMVFIKPDSSSQNSMLGSKSIPINIKNVIVTGITENSATVIWETDKPSTSKVDYGVTANYESTTDTDNTLVLKHSVEISGLLSRQTYHYKARSVDESGNEEVYGDYLFTTLADTTPPIITNIRMTGIESSSTSVTWTTDEPATSQVVYGESESYGNLTVPEANLAINHRVDITGLFGNTRYHFRTISADENMNKTISDDNVFTTAVNKNPPIITNVIKTNITDTSITIIWATDKPATTQVEYGFTKEYGSQNPENTSLAVNHILTLKNLVPDKSYHFRVISMDDSGNKAILGDYTFKTAPLSQIYSLDRKAGISLGTLWVGLRCNVSPKVNMELRYVTDPDINVISLRGSYILFARNKTTGFVGLDYGTINFKYDGISGNGNSSTPFVGSEYFLTNKMDLGIDIGYSTINLKTQEYSVNGPEWVFNIYIN